MSLSTITSRVARLFGIDTGRPTYEELTPREVYEMLDAYYLNCGLYDEITQYLLTVKKATVSARELRNPCYAAVEFYAKKLWPGELPDAIGIITENERIVEPIQQIWTWSNWSAKKQVAARNLAKYGDLFIRVAVREENGRPTGVYLQLVNPKCVTDFDVDERGIITYLRYDATRTRREGDEESTYTHTEVWTTESYRRWEHDKDYKTEINRLGEPVETLPLASFGIDFIPWVHAPFMDAGDDTTGGKNNRGMALIWPCITKIDNLNISATRLHQMMFRYGKPDRVVMSNTEDPEGRPLAAPKLTDEDELGTVTSLGDEDVYYLPGMSKMEFLVPDLDFAAHMALLEQEMTVIKMDLPELNYYDISRSEDESGRALRYKLSPAVDRIQEVRGNASTALVRAHQMALTIGQGNGLFSGLGTYENGDFDHELLLSDPLQETEEERADLAKTFCEMGVPVRVVLEHVGGWSEEELDKIMTEKAAELALENMPALTTGAAFNTPEGIQTATTAGAKQVRAGQAQPRIAQVLEQMAAQTVDRMVRDGTLERFMAQWQGKKVQR